MTWNSYNGPVLTLTPGRFSTQIDGVDTSNGNGAHALIQRTTDNGAEPTHTTHTGETVSIVGTVPDYTVDLGSELYPGTSSPTLHIVTDNGTVHAYTSWGYIYGILEGDPAVTVSGNCDFISGVCSLRITGGTPISCTADYVSVAETANWQEVDTIPYTGSSFTFTDDGLNGATAYWYRVRTQQRVTESDPWEAARWTRGSSTTSGAQTDAAIGTIYRIYDGSSTARTGTVTLNGTTAVVGSGTAFGSEFSVGDVIEVNGEARRITAITNSASLTVSTAFVQSASGQTYAGYHLVRVTALATDMLEPASAPQTYSASRALLDGTVRGLGWSATEWKWGFLLEAQRDALKALCPGKSIMTFIDTRDEEDEFKTFRAVMVWADRPEIFANRWLNFTLAFKRMEQL